MSGLTPELNLITPDGEDDTADFLDLNLEANLRTLDGLFAASTGHSHNGAHQGGTLGPNAFADNTIPGAKLVDGSVTTPKIADGAVTGPKIGAGVLEAAFAGSATIQGTNFVVPSHIMFVFCGAAIQVTLPAAASTNRPITVAAITGQSTIVAAGGSVIGGSINTSTGAVMNGTCTQGDSLTYKSDTANWRVV
jgi:hypothetical protein